MSDYLASQKTISLSYDSDIEVITPDIEKIQFASSGTVLLSRPDKLSATRTNGLRGGCGSRSLCRKARRGCRGAASCSCAPLLHASRRPRLPASRIAAHVRRGCDTVLSERCPGFAPAAAVARALGDIEQY